MKRRVRIWGAWRSVTKGLSRTELVDVALEAKQRKLTRHHVDEVYELARMKRRCRTSR